MVVPEHLQPFFQSLHIPHPDSHKGQNGKLLIVGGSELFHSASKWSLDIAAKFVDMVFYSSIPSNNELVKEAKQGFWEGIVIPRDQIAWYASEADCILIGPGMERTPELPKIVTKSVGATKLYLEPTQEEWNESTFLVTNYLLQEFAHKKWVIDAGALQMLDPRVIPDGVILTPHQGELDRLLEIYKLLEPAETQTSLLEKVVAKEGVIVQKGKIDQVHTAENIIEISGGNAGMTKGGTGDVLAGLIAALYCSNDAATAAVVGSFINKAAGDELYKKVGPNFSASDLVAQIPQTLWQHLQK